MFSKFPKSGNRINLYTNYLINKRFSSKYNFDFFVIGGGSGGLSAAKEASILGAKTGLADYVTPTPIGTKWGLGGTCVNVGCIPKKLMHYAGGVYEQLDELEAIGYTGDVKKQEHSWETLVGNVQLYIKKLNFGYKGALREKNVSYFNKKARFVDKHTIELIDAKGNKELITADKILVSVGGRPTYPDVEGARELCITSDDLFSLKKPPGKTLLVGASYISLECGGFLRALGYDVSIMVRSILLRGFDQDIANMIGAYLEKRNLKFIKDSVPTRFLKGDNGKILVEYSNKKENKVEKEEFDTVVLAVGRTAYTESLDLDKIGVSVSKSKKIVVDDYEQSTVENIYSIGDCAEGRPELTPPAIEAGKLLARRLFGGKSKKMNYDNIATTVFTPIEYGCVGLSEEKALEKYGKENIKVYHTVFKALEWSFNYDKDDDCYIKVIVNKKDNERVIGFHILSPNAGEITQGISVAMNCGLTKEILDSTVGIHPTIAENYTSVDVDKEEGDGRKGEC